MIKKILAWLNIQPSKKLKKEPKEPLDFTDKGLCSNWKVDKCYCQECLSSLTWDEALPGICPKCGSTPINTPILCSRVYRIIFYQNKWQRQTRYNIDYRTKGFVFHKAGSHGYYTLEEV
jgi:hypothetical protein